MHQREALSESNTSRIVAHASYLDMQVATTILLNRMTFA